MTEEDCMWEDFNAWHKARYGWNLRDDRAINSQDGYTGMVAWYAWKEATERAKGPNVEIERPARLFAQVRSNDGLAVGAQDMAFQAP